MGILLGGPYNSGILATGPKPGAFYNYDPAPPAILERVGRIEAVCKAHGVALVEAALRFPLGHPSVVSVIPGAQTPQEVTRNAGILGARIPASLWSDLRTKVCCAQMRRFRRKIPSSPAEILPRCNINKSI